MDVALRARARTGDVRRLERPHRDRRGAAGAAAGRKEWSGIWSSHPVGVDRRDGQDPRRGVHRQAQPDRERQRSHSTAWTSPTTTSPCSIRTPTPRRWSASRPWPTARRCGRPTRSRATPRRGWRTWRASTRPASTTRCSTAGGGSGTPRRYVPRRTSRTGAWKAPTTGTRGISRWSGRAATSATTTPRPKSSRWWTPASAATTCNSRTTRTRRCSSAGPTATCSAGSTPGCSTRPATRDCRRAGARPWWTPTATAGSRSRGTNRRWSAAPASRRTPPAAPTTPTRRWTRVSRWGPTASSSTRSTARSGARRTPIPGRSSAWWSATIRRRVASPKCSRCPPSAGTWRRAASAASCRAASTSTATASSGRRCRARTTLPASTGASADR